MPIPTKDRLPSPPAPRAERAAAGVVLIAAAAFAGLELLAATGPGRFFTWGRAEALLFLAFRPWLLLLLALAVAGRPVRTRAAAYAAALVLAALSECLFLRVLGNGAPWREAAWGVAGGAGVALAADLVVQGARRFLGRAGAWAGAAVGAAILLVPGALAPYEALVVATDPPPAPDGARPAVLLMSGLPLVWGERGPFDPSSRPAAAYGVLQQRFRFIPADTLDAATLARARILFLAQPQRLSPLELATLDAWVRAGGRVLILADPMLAWPSSLPLGDIRRPPPVSLTGPLLDHWGVRIDAPETPAPSAALWRGMKLATEGAGSVAAAGPGCARPEPWLAACRIGAGRALIVADADLLRDDLWAPVGTERHRRTADNPQIVAALLGDLAGGGDRPAPSIAWADPQASGVAALAAALLPILFAAAAGL